MGKNMKITMVDSFKRTYELIRGNLRSVLLLGAVVFIIFMILGLTQQVVVSLIYGLIFIASLIIGGGIALAVQGGALTVIGIIVLVIGILLGLLLLLTLFASIFVMASFSFGMQIFICEVLYDIKHGKKASFKGIWSAFKDDWRSILRRGMKLFFYYLLLLLPFIIVIDLVYGIAIAFFVVAVSSTNISAEAFSLAILGIALAGTLMSMVLIVVIPLLQFVLESSAMRMAEGKQAKEAVKLGLRDIRKNTKGVVYYILGILLLMLAIMIVFPLAFIAQAAFPILTKSFLIANRDMFCD